MTDPSDALASFQQALLDGEIKVQPGEVDVDLFVHADKPNGHPRFTYVRLEGQSVTALVMLVVGDPIDGIPCLQAGVAVPEKHRNQGRAKDVLSAAITEMKLGLARNKISTFYVEAVVGVHNEASKRVAATTISSAPVEITDKVSGLPALHYVRKIG